MGNDDFALDLRGSFDDLEHLGVAKPFLDRVPIALDPAGTTSCKRLRR
jgi:hypothetical protein